jgi:hypothetical protein
MMRGHVFACCALVACGGVRTVAGDEGDAATDSSSATDAPALGAACSSIDAGSPQVCPGVDQLILSSATIDGGAPSAGGDAFVQVLLSDPPNGPSIDDYPLVCFATDNPAASIDGNPAWGLYAIKAGMSATYGVRVHFGASIAPGTVLHFAAQATTAAGDCTNGAQFRWEVTAQ